MTTVERDLWRCPYCKTQVETESDYNDIPFCTECDCQYDRFDPVDVVFLRDTEYGDVFAVFPGEAATVGNLDHMTCYAHFGGHSGAASVYCDKCIEVTDPAEYADLATGLERIGYNLCVVHKACMSDSKYTDSRREQLRI